MSWCPWADVRAALYKMFNALLFDLDGTIIDSAPDVCASLNRALFSMGRLPITIEDTKMLVGFGAHPCAIEHLAFLESREVRRKSIYYLKIFDSYCKNPSEHTTIFPGAIDALNLFKDLGIQLGICTNKPESTCFPVLDALD